MSVTSVTCGDYTQVERNAYWRGLYYCRKYADFTQNFTQFTVWYHPKPFIFGAIEGKVNKGLLFDPVYGAYFVPKIQPPL